MKKKILIITAIFMTAVFTYNYTNIVTTVISKLQYEEQAITAIKIYVDPQDQRGEIAAAALDSIAAAMINNEGFYNDYKYIAIDAESFPKLSKNDKQYLITHYRKYNSKTIYSTRADLKKLFLYNPFNNSCNGGILLSVDKVKELSDERAVLEVSYHVSAYEGGGARCYLVYKNDRWQVESTEMTYIP